MFCQDPRLLVNTWMSNPVHFIKIKLIMASHLLLDYTYVLYSSSMFVSGLCLVNARKTRVQNNISQRF